MTSTAMARCGKLATTLGPAAASPLPLYPRFAAYPGCLRACRNSCWGGPSISEEAKRNTTGALVRLRFASVDGAPGVACPRVPWLV